MCVHCGFSAASERIANWPEGSRESGLPAVLIGGGEDAAVEMLGDGKTDETEGLGRLGGKHCGSDIFP